MSVTRYIVYTLQRMSHLIRISGKTTPECRKNNVEVPFLIHIRYFHISTCLNKN